MDWIAFAQPFFNLFSLGRQYDTLPGNCSGALTIFGHDVRTFVENLNDPIRVGSLEVIRRKCCVMVLHLVLG